MSGVHDRYPLSVVMSPGRKSREFWRGVTIEIHRLNDREEELSIIAATSKSAFAALLAEEQIERIAQRRHALLLRRSPKRIGRPPNHLRGL